MSVTATESIPASAFELSEATALAPATGVTIPDEIREKYTPEEQAKMVPLHVIRPGVGRGRGRHLYEADMLRENTEVFKGWKMYVNHQSPAAKKAAGGLPRNLEEAGGIVKETWWDPTVPATDRFDQGAVVGWAKPTRQVRELIEDVPEFVEASISANATGIKAISHKGQKVHLVEGIAPEGSVDWVTEAGAGGKVVALLEALVQEEDDLLHELSDDEFVNYLRDQRPHLLEAVDAPGEPDPEGGNENMSDTLTPEALQEALQQDEFQGVLKTFVEENLSTLVESAVAEERELIRAEARADADRQIELRDLRDEARKTISESRLHPVLQEQVRGLFDLTEAGPTPALDVVDDVDDDGKTVKSARAKLRESVEREITAQRDLLAAVNPTRITGQGQKALAEGETAKKSEGTYWGEMLQEAGVDPETAYQA